MNYHQHYFTHVFVKIELFALFPNYLILTQNALDISNKLFFCVMLQVYDKTINNLQNPHNSRKIKFLNLLF